jgi:hypothetical protein
LPPLPPALASRIISTIKQHSLNLNDEFINVSTTNTLHIETNTPTNQIHNNNSNGSLISANGGTGATTGSELSGDIFTSPSSEYNRPTLASNNLTDTDSVKSSDGQMIMMFGDANNLSIESCTSRNSGSGGLLIQTSNKNNDDSLNSAISSISYLVTNSSNSQENQQQKQLQHNTPSSMNNNNNSNNHSGGSSDSANSSLNIHDTSSSLGNGNALGNTSRHLDERTASFIDTKCKF